MQSDDLGHERPGPSIGEEFPHHGVDILGIARGLVRRRRAARSPLRWPGGPSGRRGSARRRRAVRVACPWPVGWRWQGLPSWSALRSWSPLRSTWVLRWRPPGRQRQPRAPRGRGRRRAGVCPWRRLPCAADGCRLRRHARRRHRGRRDPADIEATFSANRRPRHRRTVRRIRRRPRRPPATGRRPGRRRSPHTEEVRQGTSSSR